MVQAGEWAHLRRFLAQHERRRCGPPPRIGPQPRRGSRILDRGAAPKARQPRATPARAVARDAGASSPSMSAEGAVHRSESARSLEEAVAS